MADHTSSNSTIHSSEQWQAMMNKLLSGQFCFAQEENGRVVEISYEEDSHPDPLEIWGPHPHTYDSMRTPIDITSGTV